MLSGSQVREKTVHRQREEWREMLMRGGKRRTKWERDVGNRNNTLEVKRKGGCVLWEGVVKNEDGKGWESN